MGKIREEMEKVARENAIKDLKELQIDIGSSPDDLENSPLYYALDMAIKALEQQPCEDCDCISRAYIESIVEELENICINGDEYILSLLSRLKNAPPVTPEPFINKPCISEGACREDKMQTLDKIREDIMKLKHDADIIMYGIAIDDALKIIDKYRTESEE